MTEEQIKAKAKEQFPNDEFKQQAVIDAINWATKELQEQIEKMKCCGNCIHCYEGAYHNGYRCKDHARESVCDSWEMMTDEVRKEMLEDD